MFALPAALAMTVSAAAPEAGLAEDALACLALNVYHEARGETARGQLAVAHVTLNRVRDPAFPSDVCAVVTEGDDDACQFSWWCDGADDTPANPRAFGRAVRAATRAASGVAPDPTYGATFFMHTGIEPPGWTRLLRETAVIGDHRFYRR